ncbi:MAG: hypothetical protein II992_07950 [Lachnospiraceae bacterium]|nr:hypothetical protein [Lachnospiraceae bacterium]
MKSKRFIAMICVSTTLLSLSACGSGKEEKNSTNEVTSTSMETSEKEESFSSEEKLNVSTEETAGSIEELNERVEKDVDDTIIALKSEYERLKVDINTYKKYVKNTDKMEAFYANVYEVNKGICKKMYEYSLDYAELIIRSDKSNDDKYDDLEELYDNIYEDVGEKVYDEIYDGILDEMYKDFYDGILENAYDNAPYDEWSDARANEYDWWSDTRSDTYDDWSDCRSDVYDFWSDIRKEIWDDDIQKAEKKMKDFQEEIDKLK